MAIQTINPASGQVLHSYEENTPQEVEKMIQDADSAFNHWRSTAFTERKQLMLNAARVLLENKKSYATLMAEEMGKPLAQGMAEIEKCVWNCKYYAEEAERYLAPVEVKTEMKKSFITYQPLGVIFAIMPWNFPFWQVFRFAVPTLMAGNAALLKHASAVTGCGLTIEKVFMEAGFPQNLFRTLVLGGSKTQAVIQNPLVKAVTLTGSDETGSIVGSEAARVIKKVVLELGGSDPYLILADANVDKAAEAMVASRMNNMGQSCIAAKRMIVIESVQKEFEQRVLQKLQRYQMGDPLNEQTNFGPLAREDLRDHLHKQVQKSVEQGAKVLTGGFIPEGSGSYYPPTVLTQVKTGMPAFKEELFGPVISIITARSEEEAIDLANDTRYGLGGGIFSEDLRKAEKIAVEKIQAGFCCVNDYVRSDPRLPFGGIKHSGFGRELSEVGIHEFVNVKTICIA